MNKHRQKLEVLGSGGGGGGLGGIRRHSVHHTNLQVGKRGLFLQFPTKKEEKLWGKMTLKR